jgi:hypothetical protein
LSDESVTYDYRLKSRGRKPKHRRGRRAPTYLASFQPGERAAVYLQQHAFRRTTFAPPPVNGLGPAAPVAYTRLTENSVQRRTTDRDLFYFCQHFLQVTHVEVLVLAPRTCQNHDPRYQRWIDAVSRRATLVAVHHGRHTIPPEAGSQPTNLASAHS